MPPNHVLIVGGGLAGPCLALCLAAQGIKSTIFEIREGIQNAGGSITLGPNALKVLDKRAGVYQRVKEVGYVYSRFSAFTDDGGSLGQILVGDEQGYMAVRIMRPALHQILTDACEEKGVKIVWNARIKEIVEGERVTARFEDGSEVEGDLLVGADGIHSKVRALMLGDENPKTTFDKICVVYGFLDDSSVIKPNPDLTFPAFMFTPSGIFMTLQYCSDESKLAWVITKAIPYEVGQNRTRQEWKESERSGEAARLAKADYDNITTEPIRSLLDNVDESLAKIWPSYSIPEIPVWHRGRVCLIGDAAHGMPPNGHGSGLAFEDAAVLGQLLATSEDIEDTFRRFQSIRGPRVATIRKNAKVGEVGKSQSGPWMWYFKKWAFRAFFAWHRYLVPHVSETTYDVDEAIKSAK